MASFVIAGICMSSLFALAFGKELKVKYKEHKIKKLIFKKCLKKYKSEDICVICQEDFDGRETCRQLYCGHIYHDGCILRWLIEKPTCPHCNTYLKTRTNKDYYHEMRRIL